MNRRTYYAMQHLKGEVRDMGILPQVSCFAIVRRVVVMGGVWGWGS